MIAVAWRLERGRMTNRKLAVSSRPALPATPGATAEPAHDLARNILYDRLGYVPGIVIYSQFCNDIINKTCQTTSPSPTSKSTTGSTATANSSPQSPSRAFRPYAADGA
jgi:hypothetical protein